MKKTRRRTRRADIRKRAETAAEEVRRRREYQRAIMDPASGVQWPQYGEL